MPANNDQLLIQDELKDSNFVIPISAKCEEILKTQEHILIGISPFNSYYSEQKITQLIYWGKLNFKQFHLFVPNTLPYFNFLAMGYLPNKAHNKTNRQWNYLKNKIQKALVNNGFSMQHFSEKIITISDHLSKNPIYNQLHQACLKKYDEDSFFKKTCLNVSKIVLSNYTDLITDQKNLEIAVQYLLAELPLYLNTPDILMVPSSLFVYHEKLNFFYDLYNTRTNELLANNQGHLIVTF